MCWKIQHKIWLIFFFNWLESPCASSHDSWYEKTSFFFLNFQPIEHFESYIFLIWRVKHHFSRINIWLPPYRDQRAQFFHCAVCAMIPLHSPAYSNWIYSQAMKLIPCKVHIPCALKSPSKKRTLQGHQQHPHYCVYIPLPVPSSFQPRVIQCGWCLERVPGHKVYTSLGEHWTWPWLHCVRKLFCFFCPMAVECNNTGHVPWKESDGTDTWWLCRRNHPKAVDADWIFDEEWIVGEVELRM